jgi:site-specific DNA-methyltransferase (adenine-specific)
MRVETIAEATLYLGDCRDVMPAIGTADALVTDPPMSSGSSMRATTIDRKPTKAAMAPG